MSKPSDDKVHNKIELKTLRKLLRNNGTSAEATLWVLLKGKQLQGRKFRRQHSVGNYVLDFYCHEIKLCIEADGGIHNEKNIKEYDIERTKVLNENGITVLRFTNKEIIERIAMVVNKIEAFVKNRSDK